MSSNPSNSGYPWTSLLEYIPEVYNNQVVMVSDPLIFRIFHAILMTRLHIDHF